MQHFPQPHSFSRHSFLTCPLLPTSTALVFIHEHTYIYHVIMKAWYNLKEKVNLCSHYGTFRHSFQSTKKRPHLEIMCVCLPVPWHQELLNWIFNNLIWGTLTLSCWAAWFSAVTHKFTLCKSINELLISISYIADNMWWNSTWNLSWSMLGRSDILPYWSWQSLP